MEITLITNNIDAEIVPTVVQVDLGPDGVQGQAGAGVPAGGTAGQVLAKIDTVDRNTEWIAPGVPYSGATDNVDLGAFHIAATAGTLATLTASTIYATGGDPSIQVLDHQLLDINGDPVLVWNLPGGAVEIPLINTNQINDAASGNHAINLASRQLIAADGATAILDFSNDGSAYFLTNTITSTGRCNIGTGSALVPSYAFNADANTGMYAAASDTLAFATGGVERLRVTATGRVGVGTTNPLGVVDVSGSSASTDLVAFDATRSLSVINTNTTTNNAQGIALRSQSTNGTIASGVKLLAVNTARTATNLTSDFAVLTNNAGTISEKFRILANGNVGINTPNPSALLHVRLSDTTNVTSNGSLVTGTNGSITRYELAPNASVAYGLAATLSVDGGALRLCQGAASSYITGAQQASAVMHFFVQDVGAPKMSVFQSGNVAIGTATPSARIHAISTTEQLRIGFDASNFYSTTVGATGLVTFNAVGSGSAFTFSDAVTAPSFNLASKQTYTASNVTVDRSYDANSTTIDELADVVGTLIADLRTAGLIA